jgi:hypothetical protein
VRTEAFIRALAADRAVEIRPGLAFGLALAAGAVIAATVFLLALGVRPDILAVLHTVRFPFKFVVTIALFAAGLRLVLALARPGGDAAAAARLLAVPALLIGGALVIELAVVPMAAWGPRLIGSNATVCLSAIPVIAIGPLVAILLALRSGAPTAPRRAGASAGLVAAALAATFYAAHCTDDSPLFVATGYSLAIAFVVAVGALLGPRLLRW